jgi:hypothetical protein
VTTTTTTTISGVSLITRQGARAPEVFEIVLSAGGIDFRRAERPGARLTWDRVSAWEIEEREGDVVLTLQGDDAVTPLLIPGWSAADLAALLRQLTEQPAPAKAASVPAKKAAATKKPAQAKKAAQPKKAVAAKKPPPATRPVVATPTAAPDGTSRVAAPPGVVELLGTAEAQAAAPKAAATTDEQGAARATPRERLLVPWKAVVTIALLGVLATAVTIVLLQSAGIINWSFLGPNI